MPDAPSELISHRWIGIEAVNTGYIHFDAFRNSSTNWKRSSVDAIGKLGLDNAASESKGDSAFCLQVTLRSGLEGMPPS